MNDKLVQGSAALRGARTQALKETASTRKAMVSNLIKIGKQGRVEAAKSSTDVIKTRKGAVYVQAKRPTKGGVVWHDAKGNYFVQVLAPPTNFVVRRFSTVGKKAGKAKS